MDASRRAPRRPTASSSIRVVRDQIGHGADWIKVYADYRWGRAAARPTFTLEELTARRRRPRSSSGTPVAAHATTAEGMRRAMLAGVETIEHGDAGTPEMFKLMAELTSRSVRRSRPATRRRNTRAGRRAAARARRDRPQARQLQGGARRRRHDSQRQRRRRVHARRQRARAGIDGGLRNVAARRAEERDVGRRAGAAHGRSHRPRQARAARRPRRRRRRSRRATSPRCVA